MKTSYLPAHPDWEPLPEEFPDTSDPHFDYDGVTDLMTEFATYFTVIAVNPGGWRRGESNYIRSEHLTLQSALLAAKTRYQNDPQKRGCLIYAVMQYSNRPIGSDRVIASWPEVSNPYSREARAAKRKQSRIPKNMRNLPAPETMKRSERFFEPSPEQLREIEQKLADVKIVGKGGSKVAFKYRNKGSR